MLRGEVTIGSKKFFSKKTGFVSPRTGADFEKNIFVVVGIFGKQKKLQLFCERLNAWLDGSYIILCHLTKILIGFRREQDFILFKISCECFVLLINLNDFIELSMLLH